MCSNLAKKLPCLAAGTPTGLTASGTGGLTLSHCADSEAFVAGSGDPDFAASSDVLRPSAISSAEVQGQLKVTGYFR